MRVKRWFGIVMVSVFVFVAALAQAQEVQKPRQVDGSQQIDVPQPGPAAQQGPIPQMINYQGQLRDNNGQAANGASTIVFKIYAAATEGTALYTETQNVMVSNGVFNVLLGSVTPIPLNLFESGTARFLEITVNNTVMTPRRQFGSVPYAFSSGTTLVTTSGTNGVPGGWDDDGTVVRLTTITDNVGIGTITPDHKLTVDVGALSANNGIHLIGDVSTINDLRLQLEYDDVANLSHHIYDDGSESHNFEIESRNALAFNTGGPTERMRITNTGNVGIGIATPGAKLHVAGTGVNVGMLLDNGGDLMWKTTAGTNTPVLTLHSNNDVYLDAGASSLSDLRFRAGSPSLVERMTILNNGNVGIGMTSPAFKLDVTSQTRLGQAEIGSWPASSTYAYFGHQALDHAVIGNFALLQYSSGATFLNAGAGQAISFKINNGTHMTLASTGNVGIGTTAPSTKLQVNGAENNGTIAGLKINSGAQNMLLDGNEIDALADGLFLNNNTNQKVVLANGGGNVGIGTTAPTTKLQVNGAENNGTVAGLKINSGVQNMLLDGNEIDALVDGLFLNNNTNQNVVLANGGGRVGIGTASPATKLHVSGTTRTRILEITAGADLSEQFEVNTAEDKAALEPVQPGMVVCIDARNPGKLILSNEAYDHKVAGIISGAGGINTGMLMGQENSVAHGSTPVALAGRVYCWADASFGAILPGDLLTTSDTPGHAMKANDYAQAQGAILGKAMTSLQAGKGLVLVLVTLQ